MINLLYAFNLVLGGILFGAGFVNEDGYLMTAGIILVGSNLLPFIPWREE
jgi:hypothetical protein